MSNFSTLFDLIGVLARRRHQAGERGFAALGLNHTEARLLTLLDQQGGEATQDALSNMLFIDRSNAGRALKNLEAEKFVERSAETADRRTKSVHITDRGRQTAAEIGKLRKQLAETFFGDLTEEEACVVADLLAKAIGEQR